MKMLPSLSGRAMGQRAFGLANALRDTNTSRNVAEAAEYGVDFDTISKVPAGNGFEKDAVEAPNLSSDLCFAKAKNCVGYIPHGEDKLSLRIASPELIAGHFEDLHKFYEDPIASSGVQKGGNAISLTTVEKSSYKTRNSGQGATLSATTENKIFQAVTVVRYNAELPFPYEKGKSPYNIDESDSTLDKIDNGFLLGAEQEARCAAYRASLDQLIGTQLKPESGGQIIEPEFFRRNMSEKDEFAIPVIDLTSSDGGSEQGPIMPEEARVQPEPELNVEDSEGHEKVVGDGDLSYFEEEYPDLEKFEHALVDDNGSLFGNEYSEGFRPEPARGNNHIPDQEFPEQMLVEEDFFHSQGEYSDEKSFEGFVDEEPRISYHNFQHQGTSGQQPPQPFIQQEATTFFGSSQHRNYFSLYSIPLLAQPAVIATGSAADPMSISDSPVPQQSMQNASSHAHRPNPTSKNGIQNHPPKPKQKNCKSESKEPKPQAWRSNEKGAYKKRTGELLKGTLFPFLRKYLNKFRPTEQLPKPWDYPAKLARWERFSTAEKAHFHEHVKRIVDAELHADRQEERKLIQEIMAAGNNMFTNPIVSPLPRRIQHGMGHILEAKASTDTQLFQEYQIPQNKFGFENPDGHPEMSHHENLISYASYQHELGLSSNAFRVGGPNWANDDFANYADGMSIRRPQHRNSFLQEMKHSDSMVGMSTHGTGTFDLTYGTSSEGIPQDTPHDSMVGYHPAPPARLGHKRKTLDDDSGAEEEGANTTRPMKRTRRV